MKRENVLIVDDEKNIRLTLRRALEKKPLHIRIYLRLLQRTINSVLTMQKPQSGRRLPIPAPYD